MGRSLQQLQRNQLASEGDLHSGLLHKKGDYLNVWRLRYFVLRKEPARLDYYKYPFSRLRGSLPLNADWHVKTADNVIRLSNRKLSRSVLLSAPSSSVAEVWSAAICALKGETKLASDSVLAGDFVCSTASLARSDNSSSQSSESRESSPIIDLYFRRRRWKALAEQVPYELLNPVFNSVADLALNRRQWNLEIVQDEVQLFVRGSRLKLLTSFDCEPAVVARLLDGTSPRPSWDLSTLVSTSESYSPSTSLVSIELEVLLGQRRQVRVLRHQRWLGEDMYVMAERSVNSTMRLEGGWACWAHPGRRGACSVAAIYRLELGGALDWLGLGGFAARRLLHTQMQCLKAAALNASPVYEERECQQKEQYDAGEGFAPTLTHILDEEGFTFAEHGALKYIDYEEIAKQKSVALDILKGFGSNLIHARSLTSVPMPVRIFEARSLLERMTDLWGFAPTFLTRASEVRDPVERLKLVVTFVIAGLHRGLRQKKPFNPILGEVFRGCFSDGSEVFLEQVSHHPPISGFQLFGPNGSYQMHGRHEYKASLRPNSLSGAQLGPTQFEFADGGHIELSGMPSMLLQGSIWGDRIVSWRGELIFKDMKNNLICELQVNPNALRKGWFSRSSNAYRMDAVVGDLRVNDAQTITVSGSWLGELRFDDVSYFDALSDASAFEQARACPHPELLLPSEARFRSDLCALKSNDMPLAARCKLQLEQLQRADCKLRAEGAARI